MLAVPLNPARVLLASLALFVPFACVASAANAAVVINEVESDGGVGPDFIELKNTGPGAVDLGGYALKDSNDGNTFTFAGGTSIAANAYVVADALGFGLSSGDAARLFAPGDLVTPIDSFSWTSHAAATYGRCPDGTGPIVGTSSSTSGATNDCPVPALTWPGGASVSVADGVGTFGGNLSGLVYQPSGTSTRGVLWAVRNGPSTLFRLVFDGTKWTPDTANGWSAGKTLVYPDGSGVPDAEGVTLAGGDASGIYVSTERNDNGALSNTSRPGVLRYDVSSAATTLVATKEWDLTANIPGLGANLGLEAVAWVPDSLLISKGFKDESTGLAYNPSTYANHGSGLFFVGVEADGRILAFALNQTTGAFTRVATIASGFPKVMDLSFEPESTHLWAACDDSCDGRTSILDIAAAGADAGRFVVTKTFDRPAGAANLNNEGFAIAPQAECVGGLKPVFWADDSNTDLHAVRAGTLSCTVPPVVVPPVEEPPVGQPPVGQPPVGGTPGTTPPVVGTPAPAQPAIPGDVTAPTLTLAFKSTKEIRRTGKFGVSVTLQEATKLTLTATVRKGSKGKLRTVVTTTRSNVAPGTRTQTLTLTKTARKALRKGETLTLTVVVQDAAGNQTTRTISKKVA